jgi:hypothetical protein
MTRSFGLTMVCFVAAFAVALATGCGGSGSTNAIAREPISLQELAQSATSSADAISGRFAFDMSMSLPRADEAFAFSGEGAFDAKSERASFSVDMSSFASLLGGLFAGMAAPNAAGAPDFDDPSGWKIEAIQDGTVSYVRFPAMDDQLPAGKSWVRTDESKPGAKQGTDFDFQQLTNNDPRTMLDFLRAASAEIETVGSEELRGEDTTHYRATIEPREYAKLAPLEKREELQSLVQQMGAQSGLTTVPVEGVAGCRRARSEAVVRVLRDATGKLGAERCLDHVRALGLRQGCRHRASACLRGGRRFGRPLLGTAQWAHGERPRRPGRSGDPRA